MMPELLGRQTSMPITLVPRQDDGVAVRPDHVYLIPPGKQMVIQNGRLFLSDRDDGEQLSLPIDQFMLSLAHDQGRFAVGIILSGTGADGSSGVADIYRAGGLVMAQDPRSAKYDSMPERAIATGLCDVVQPADGLAQALARYVRQSLSREQMETIQVSSSREGNEILDILREHSEIDFSVYKPTTVMRRIQRRQELRNFPDTTAYRKCLQTDENERNDLLNDLLIGVTKFYRNKEAFEVLQHEAVTKILAGKEENEEVRIWVAGCATGEEAYSIAFMLDEAIERLDKKLRFKLFATDAHRPAIDSAALGIFGPASMRVLPESKVQKYFVKTKDAYQVIPRIRQQIVFVQHELMKDAPFTRMDLVTCRNLLIYLQPEAQTKCLSLFHFALVAGGFLFLGSSESVGVLEEEFEPINSTWRLFRKLRDVTLATNRAEANRRAIAATNLLGARAPELQRENRPPTRLPEQELQRAYDMLLEKLLSAGFLVDAQGQLLHTFAGGGHFLQLDSGRHSSHLLDLIHPDLRSSLSAGIQHCRRDRKKVVYSGVSAVLHQNDIPRIFDLTVEPISRTADDAPLLLISVSELQSSANDTDSTGQSRDVTRVDVSEGEQDSLRSLENELAFTRENLQATIQELESSNEELQATNEEMVASNEELQSTNEELQSVNEELHTVNAEYHRKIAQLQNANDDMDNLLSSSEVSVLFLDESLSIRRFTPNLATLFGLRAQDTGRSIESFQTSFVSPRLRECFHQVLAERKAITQELPHPDGRIFMVRITPFDSSTIADGVVVNYVDTTEMREKEEVAKRWASIVQSTADCIVAVDMTGAITQWNPAAVELYGWSEEEAIGRNLYDLVVPRESRGDMAKYVEQVRSDQTSTQFDSTRVTRDGKTLDVMARLSPVLGTHGIVGISSIERDVTTYRRQSRLRVFEESVRTNFFAERGSGTGLKQLAEVATETFGPRALWVWRVDNLTGDLTADFSSFGPGEADWLARNKIKLSELAIECFESRERIQPNIEFAPPVTADQSGEQHASPDGRWRLLLKPLLYKDESLGVIAVLIEVTSNEEYDEIRSSMLAVSRSLAIQIADEHHYDALRRISAIVENASDFIGTSDSSGRVVSINRAGRLMTGIGLDDDTSTLQIKDLHPPESRKTILTVGIPEAKRTGHWTGETELIDRNGNRLPVSQLITAHRDESGRLRYMSTICRVMSDQKGIQTRLEKLIQQTRSDSDMKTTFLANVSHDVRTPMTSVIGLAELLLEQDFEPEHKSMLQTMRDNGVYVTRLLNDLLDLSKVESGKLTIAPAPVDLRQLMREIERAFRPIAEQAELEFSLTTSGLPEEPLSLDPTRFRQIIENLISNAIKFTNSGFVRVSTASDGEMFSVEVADSGCGIENSMLSSVFDPYMQSSPTSTRRIRGAGLGLAISRKLAERMDGELRVASEAGQGSSFTLRLPAKVAVADSRDGAKTGPQFLAEEKPLADKRILVAEDTRGIQFLVQRILTKQGVIVTLVENGQQALDQVEQSAKTGRPFDALLLDMQMPVLDGYEAARKIRAAGHDLPIIALTASTMREEQAASLESGCDRFLPKPINQTDLLTVIWQMLQEPR
jgi:two-component system CheB/CheR fusion protein